MLNPQYKLYINDVWFESLFPADYYNKRVYFATGARRFFTVYQVMRTGDFSLSIVDDATGHRLELPTAAAFKEWVEKNYSNFSHCLDGLEWAKEA